MKNIVVPMAGLGTRFSNTNDVPKPIISISGKPMVVRSVEYLPKADRYIFVCLNEHLNNFPIEEKISNYIPNSIFIGIEEVTPGLIFTAEIGIKEGIEDKNDLVTVACSDGACVYNIKKYYDLIKKQEIDAFVWGIKNDPASCANSKAYEWIEVDGLSVKRIGIKEPVSDNPYEDNMVLGAFTFRRAQDYLDTMVEIKKEMDLGVTNEFYGGHLINNMIKNGKKVSLMSADLFVGWGYPDQVRQYNLWQEYFKKILL